MTIGMLGRLGARWLAPAGDGARLTILIFHRVLPAHDPLQPGEPSVAEFERQLRWTRNWFNVIPLAQAARGLKSGALPERPLAITFDDGYADNHDFALPVLRKLGLPATFFVATGYLDGGVMFNDIVIESLRQAPGDELDLEGIELGRWPIPSVHARSRAIEPLLSRLKYLPAADRERRAWQVAELSRATIPNDLMMRSDQVAALHAAGMEIGGHTVSHPILNEVSLDVARDEMARGRSSLESITGAPVRLFAYPNGRPGRDYSGDHARLVRELGFEAAVSTAWGTAGRDADTFQLPRFTPWDRSQWRYGLRLLRNLARNGFATA